MRRRHSISILSVSCSSSKFSIMGMSKCYSLMKCLLILMDILLMCVGAVVCVFAVWALYMGVGSEMSHSGVEARSGLAAVGSWGTLVTLGSAGGVAGAARGAPSLLAGSFALLALCALAEGAAGWWGAAHLSLLERALRDRLLYTIQQEYGHTQSATQLVDVLQYELQCCGTDGPRDWQSSQWSRALQSPPSSPLDSLTDTATPSPTSPPVDLTVGAPAPYYRVPPSCCESAESSSCSSSSVIPWASNGGAGVRGAGCAPRVWAALGEAGRAGAGGAALLLAVHALALLLTLALALHTHPAHRYKA